MLLDTTTDTIELVLAANVTTSQLHYYTSFNVVTSTSLTPSKQFGSSNNTTAVTILSAPSSNQQHQLRYCSIYNCDSASATVTIRLNNNGTFRNLLVVTLLVGEYVQFTYGKGWQCFHANGMLKTFGTALNPSAVRAPAFFNAVNTSTLYTLTNGVATAVYLGVADRSYNQITIGCSVSTQLAGAVTYCEVAIFKGYPTIGSNCTLTRCGFTDVQQGSSIGFNATGVKAVPIFVTDINVGDNLWVVFGSSVATTAPVIRSGVVDNIGAGVVQTAAATTRPSTNSPITFTLQTATNIPWVTWVGSQR
jgi:hypothetical protein